MAAGDAVREIKDRLDITEVVGSYVELHKAGRHFKGKSPFTSENTPSFYVSPDRGMYYCFSSSQGGDMFTFIEKMEGVDFKGALKILAERAGVELVPEDPKLRDARERRYALIAAAAEFFFAEREKHPLVTEYLTTRGVQPPTLLAWQIGYAPNEWRALKEYLLSKQYTEADILACGLIKKTDSAKESYDVFRDRVMFPIADPSGRVVAFSGRIFSKDSDAPKYVNSPETELFQKSHILYGYDKARHGIRSLDFSLIVEGQFDVVLAHQAGYTNAVAVSGTALTPEHVRVLSRLSHKSVLALDSDRAGINAMKRAATLMLPQGMDVKVAPLPDGKDPADIIAEDINQFRSYIGSSQHVIEYLLSYLKKNARDERAYKLLVREDLVPILAVIPSEIDREHFEGVVAESLNTTKDAIHGEVTRARASRNEKKTQTTETSVAQVTRSQEVTRTRTDEYPIYFGTLVVILKTEETHAMLSEQIQSAYEAVATACDEDIYTPSADECNEYIARMSTALQVPYEDRVRDMSRRELVEEVTHHFAVFFKEHLGRKVKEVRSRIIAKEGVGETVDGELGELTELQSRLALGFETNHFFNTT